MFSLSKSNVSGRRLARLGAIALLADACVGRFANAASPCDGALAQGAVCEAANQRALEIMKSGNLEAIIVMQDVKTGSLVAFAASDPAKLDVTTALAPLSPVKLLVAASWLDHDGARQADSEKLLADSIASGNDNAGRRIASEVRNAV